MVNKFRIDRRTHLKGTRRRPSATAFGDHGLGRRKQGRESRTTGPPWLHVHAARRHSRSVLAGECGELSDFAATCFGIAEARARPVLAHEGHLGRTDRAF